MILFERIPRKHLFSGMTPGWLLGVIFFVGAIVSAYLLKESGIARITTCPTTLLLDIPCPFCGGTRSTVAMLSGDPIGAFWWNPLVASALVATPLWLGIWMVFGFRLRLAVSPSLFLAGFLLLLMLNWAYVLGNKDTSAVSDDRHGRPGMVGFDVPGR